jgi:hypothetical protein
MVNRVNRKAGDEHGRLTLIETAKRNGVGGWVCYCVCGGLTFVRFDSIKSTNSCGCLRKELGKARKTHGKLGTKVYEAWHSMKQRCLNPNHKAYRNYGGRGITVSEEWVNSFENFLKDMGEPTPGMELDRIDNEAGYSAQNCRWVTRKENARNRRTNVSMDGMTLAEAAERSGYSVQVLSWRTKKMGMTLTQAMQTPKLRNR